MASTVTQGQATGGSEFVYDAGGNRLKQKTKIGTTDAKEVRYLVDPNTSYAQVVQERDENNVLQARYAWEDGLAPLVMWRRTKTGAYAAFFYLCDGQDSVRQLTDASGKVTDSYFYDAFGNALQGGSGDTPNSFRYTGQQLDPSNKYYLRARYYNSGNGRFLSHDAMRGNSQDPDSFHRYLYCSNDGVNMVDPSGDFDFSIAGFTVSFSIGNIGVRGASGQAVSYTYKQAAQKIAGNFLLPAIASGATVGAFYQSTNGDFATGFSVGARAYSALRISSIRGTLKQTVTMGILAGVGQLLSQWVYDVGGKTLSPALQNQYWKKGVRTFLEGFTESVEGSAYSSEISWLNYGVTFALTVAQGRASGDSWSKSIVDGVFAVGLAGLIGEVIPGSQASGSGEIEEGLKWFAAFAGTGELNIIGEMFGDALSGELASPAGF